MAADFVTVINSAPTGWVRELGLLFVEATADRVVATLEVEERHHQGYGIVHGGVYAGIIETLSSVGAHLHASKEGRAVAGLENHTSFIRAIRTGSLTATATPITRPPEPSLAVRHRGQRGPPGGHRPGAPAQLRARRGDRR